MHHPTVRSDRSLRTVPPRGFKSHCVGPDDFSRERLRRVFRKKAAVLIHQHSKTSAYLQIYIITHLQIYIITHLQIYIITHLQIYIITHLQIYIITHLQIYIITHLQIYIISHLQIYIVSHLQIYIISHLQIYIFTCLQISSLSLSHCMSPSRSSFFLSKAGAGPPDRHETQPFRTKWMSNVKN